MPQDETVAAQREAPADGPDGATALRSLEAVLRGLRSALVAVSGGVDSAVVLAAAVRVVPTVVAATGTSPAYAREDLRAAGELASRLGVEHLEVPTRETTDPRYAVNTPERCFHCKTELYGRLAEIARERGLEAILDGTHADDADDYRPGMRAAAALGVRSPLREAGLGKAAVRAIARHLDLPVWDKPASPCLASRFPYGEVITLEKLTMVDRAEALLRGLGFRELRVRHHGTVARIEVPRADMPRLLQCADEVVRGLKALGYAYVAMDLQGFRSGSLNEVLGPRSAGGRAPVA
jgi:uncharacterized protein